MQLDDISKAASHPIVAAAAGSVVGLYAFPGATWALRATNVLAGFVIAVYGGTSLVEHLHIESIRIAAGVIFIAGATGLVVFNSTIEAIRKVDWSGWIRSVLPGKKGGDDAP